MPSSAFAEGTILDGEYALLEPIGRGSSRVFRVRRIRDGELFVARICYGASALELEAALAKLAAVRSVRHPALAALETFRAQDDGSFVIVSEFVRGKPLDVWAEAVGIPPLPRVIALVHRICAGLHAADRIGLAHDSLHPGNLLVSQQGNDPRPQVKIVDFGLPAFTRAWPPSRDLLQFMAPEKLRAVLAGDRTGTEADARSSVYSCGCLLYDLCTGGAPFQGGDLREIAAAHDTGKLTPPARINPQIPALLEEIILMALARAPRERFARCAELARALSTIRMSGSSSGVRALSTRTASTPAPQSELPDLTEQDARTTARSDFEEHPTVERQLPEGWPMLATLSEPPAPGAAPTTVRPPPPAAAEAEIPAPAKLPPPPSIPARQRRPIAPHGPTTPIEPLWIAEIAPPAPLARVEPDRLIAVAIADSPNRYFMIEEARIRARARNTRIAAGIAAGLLASTAVYFGVRGTATEEATRAASAVTVSPEPGAALPDDRAALARAATSAPPRLPVAAVEVGAERPQASAIVADRAKRANAIAERRGRGPAYPASARTIPRPERIAPEELPTPRLVREASEPASAERPSAAHDEPLHRPESAAADVAPTAETQGPRWGAASSRASERPATTALEPAGRPLPRTPPPQPARSSGSLSLQVGRLEVRGSLATSEVRRAIDRVKPQLTSCFTRANVPADARPLQVEVDIDERGRARSPRVTGAAAPELTRCVAQIAGKLVSATPPDTGTVKASFALELAP